MARETEAESFDLLTLDCAGTEAVNTLTLVGADDNVLQCSTWLHKEDGIGLTTLGLASAGHALATVGLHATIKGASDLLRGSEVDSPSRARNFEGECTLLGSGEGGSAKDGGDLEEKHCVWMTGS